ncbi:MAG: MerR family DNA-binding transcriptional regulator, partial [Ilumatobacter sp.]
MLTCSSRAVVLMSDVLISQPMSRSRESSDPLLAIGALADRTGVSISAIRFYEAKGLVDS